MRAPWATWITRFVLAGACALLGGAAGDACTGIRLRTNDGAIIYARTMEYGIQLDSDIAIIPRGRAYTGTAPGGPGLAWKNRYGIVGANAWGLDQVVDGMNERGLAGGLFYHPGYAEYPPVLKKDLGRTIASWELVTWALGNFSTVSEVKAGLDQVIVGNAAQPKIGFAPPLHAIFHDAEGNCLVVEFAGGKVQTYDNPLGVITNAPTFDWHLTNLRNFVNLSPVNVTTAKIEGVDVSQLGQGSGMRGLPGDFTPPSRFVRAVAFVNAATPVDTAAEGINLAHHILSSFDIFPGLVRGTGDASKYPEITQWATFADLKNKAYFFRSYRDPTIRKVDLSGVKFDADKVLVVPMHTDQPAYQDVTNRSRILAR
ncbi:MAG: linear amide C-N hydrolase [Pirellulales bacterium]